MGDGSLIDLLIRVLVVLFLVFVNAFFVAMEFALVRVRPTRIAELAESGNTAARILKRALEDPDRYIAASQLGITMASLVLGWVGESTIGLLIEPLLDFLPWEYIGIASTSVGVVVSFALLSFLHIVLGEQVPKVLALREAESVALLTIGPTALFDRLFRPFISLLDRASLVVLRALGTNEMPSHGSAYSVEELRQLVEQSSESGVLEETEREMLQNVFDFGKIPARRVMVPRTEIVAIPVEASVKDLLTLASQESYSKYPVYENDLDHIIGVVHIRDAIQVLLDSRLDSSIRGLVIEPLIVPESIRIDDLLARFRPRKIDMAILMDEFGGTAGLVTLQDLAEEVFGTIEVEFEEEDSDLQRLPDGTYLLSGLMPIEDVNEKLGLNLHDANYATIAGFVLGKFGRIPKVGDEIQVDNYIFRVEAMDGLRIARLAMIPVSPPAGAQEVSQEVASPGE
ncbi:MAG: HlyC/CorC family transporter [Chloroflexi bacterium]|nr:HlyC/CorC family transporter [Chloroflexota bacterium]